MDFRETHSNRQVGCLEERSVVYTEIHPVRSWFRSGRNLYPGAAPPSRIFSFRVRVLLLYESILDPVVTSDSQGECWRDVYFL